MVQNLEPIGVVQWQILEDWLRESLEYHIMMNVLDTNCTQIPAFQKPRMNHGVEAV